MNKCKFCDLANYSDDEGNKRFLELGYDCYTSLTMFYNNKRGTFWIAAYGEGEVEIEINYCPKCGRKLN